MDSLVKYFVKNSILPISLYDRDMRLLAMSRSWKEMYQISDDQIGQSHYQTFQLQPPHWIAAHQAALNGNTLEHTEEPYKLPNGAAGWHRWQCLPWCGVDGSVHGIIISAEDITSKKDREIELNALLARFELIQQAAKIGMWDWDIVRRNITFNAEYYEVLGWDKYRNLSNEEFYDLIHSDDLDRVKLALNSALNGGADYEAEFRIYRHNDGKLRWVKDKGTIEFDANGAPVRGYGAIIDITGIKLERTTNLRLAGEEYQSYLRNMSVGIAVYDRMGVFMYVNNEFSKMLGYSENEIIGTSCFKYIESSNREFAEKQLRDRDLGISAKYEATLKHRDGHLISFVISAKPIVEQGEITGNIATVLNLSSERVDVDSLIDRIQELERMLNSKK